MIPINNGETVRKVEGIAFLEMSLNVRPYGHLARIGNQHLNNRPSFCSIFQRKKGLSRFKAVINRLVPEDLLFLPLAHNDVYTVIPHVQGLCRTLNAISENYHCFIGQDFPRLLHWKFLRGYHVLYDSSKIDPCHNYPPY